MLSIENEMLANFNFKGLINDFSSKNARKISFE